MVKESFIVTILSVFLSIFGFLSQMLIAMFFGASNGLDIYLTLTSVPVLISSLIVTALSYFLTPFLVKSKIKLGTENSVFLTHLLIKILLISILISIFGYIIFNTFLIDIFNNITPYNKNTSKYISFIAWATIPFTIFSGFITCQFISKKKFITPVFLSFFPYFFSIILVFFYNRNLGVLSLSIGLFSGTFFATISGFLFLLRDFSFGKKSFEINNLIITFLKKLPIVALAMLCFTIFQSIDAYWANKLGPSNLSYLGYAQRIIIALGAIVITAPSSIMTPRITESLENKNYNNFAKEVKLIITLVISLGSMIALIVSIFAFKVVNVLLVRGLFTNSDAQKVATILPYMLIGMVFMLVVVIIFRILFVKNDVAFVALMGCVSVIFYYTFSGLAVYFNSLTGICIGYIINWFVLFLMSIRRLFDIKFKNFINKEMIKFLFKLISNLTLTGLSLFFGKQIISNYLNTTSFFSSLLILLFTFTFGTIIFFIFGLLFKQYEIIFLIKNVFSFVLNKKEKRV